MEYKIAKGVYDVLPRDAQEWRCVHLWQHVEKIIRQLTTRFGYREIRTPLFESTDLFSRSIGTTSDIVTKEMYTFHDRAGRSLTLRPEGTAPVMRAFIETRLDQQAPFHKLFYLCPMFRYERQQAGRYRQHSQFGVEAIGNASPLQDVEVIDLLYSTFKAFGLKGLSLQLNSIGDVEARKDFRQALKTYLRPFVHELSEESQRRYDTNPLRILDSKDSHDKKILKEAPSILDFLNETSKTHFETVCTLLKEIEVPYVINPLLVRGLDYYTDTVFEITAAELGAQNSLGGGGRYNGLIKQLGGPDLPAIGFGCGLERIILTMLGQGVELPTPPHSLLYLIPLGDAAMQKCFHLVHQLRAQGLAVEMDFSGKKLKNAMRYADASGARYTAVVGENELENGTLELKEMSSGAVQLVAIDALKDTLKNV